MKNKFSLKTHKKDIYIFCAFLPIAFIFILINSVSTSFLYQYAGYDSAIFMLVGKAVAEGQTLYVDIFDHKGPAFFFFEALMMKIGGVRFVFFCQIINLSIIFFSVYKIFGLFCNKLKYFLIPFVVLITYLSSTFEAGNLTEEYSITLIFIAFYFGLKYSIGEKDEHPVKYSFLYGAVFGLLALTRLTNAISICTLVFAIFLYLLYKKEWKNIISNICSFILGVIFVSLPFYVYFVSVNGLEDMIYATFTFNFKYASTFSNSIEWSLKELIYQIRIWAPNIFAVLSAFVFVHYSTQKNIKLLLIVLLTGIFTPLVLTKGLKTDHYMTLSSVPFLIGVILFVGTLFTKNCPGYIKYILGLFLLSMCIYFTKKGMEITNAYKIMGPGTSFYYLDKGLVQKLIPEDEKDSVFGYNLASNWYLETDIIPPFKFYTAQEIWTRTDSLVYFETNKYLESKPPKWIVIPDARIVNSTVGVDSNPLLKRMLENDYTLKGEDRNHKYYKRKDK